MNARAGRSFRSKRRNSRALFALLVVLSTLIYVINLGNDEAFRKTRTSAEGIGATIMTYLTLPVRGFENFAGDIKGRLNAHAENDRLKQEVSRLSDAEARANALAVKLSQFQKILNVDVDSGVPDIKIAARAVSETDGPFARTALINVGVKKGVSKGDAVMTVDGLFGHVVRVGNRSARVLKLEDLNSRIAVMSKETQARAILSGDNTAFPQLSYVAREGDWMDGNTVITSGDDGLLPTGLPIGTVISDGGSEKRVQLFANRNFADWVWVYPYDQVKTPEEDPAAEPEQILNSVENDDVIQDTETTEVSGETPL